MASTLDSRHVRLSMNSAIRFFPGSEHGPAGSPCAASADNQTATSLNDIIPAATPKDDTGRVHVGLEENGSLPRSLIAGVVPGPTSKALRGQDLGVG